MSGLRERAFLRRNGMEAEDFDLDSGLQEYLEEMRRGLSGEPSSLEMIPTYIELPETIPVGEPVIARPWRSGYPPCQLLLWSNSSSLRATILCRFCGVTRFTMDLATRILNPFGHSSSGRARNSLERAGAR